MSNPTIETTVACKVTVSTVLIFPEVADRPRVASRKGARMPAGRSRYSPSATLPTRPFLVERLRITWTWGPWRDGASEWTSSIRVHGRHMLTSGGMGVDDTVSEWDLDDEGKAFLAELIEQHRPTGNPTLVWE